MRKLVTEIATLDSVCRLITDGKHGDCRNEDESGYFFLSAKDVKDGKLNYENARQIAKEDFLQTHKRTQLEPLDILISNSGTIGRMAIAQDVEETYRTTFQKSVAILKPDKNRVDPYWLYYYLHHVRDRLINTAGGTAQSNLLLRDLRSFEVEIYPLPFQRKISTILCAHDNLIENNIRRIKILEEMARAIYREWFVHFRFPGHEKVKMVDSPSGKMPEGWEMRRLDGFGTVVLGKTPSKAKPEYFGSEMPFIKLPDMHGNVFCIDTSEKLSALGVDSQKSKTIPADSLCVSCIGTAGEVCIASEPSQTNQQINSIVLENLTYREFLYCALLGLRATINQFGATGATMVNLNKEKFAALTALHLCEGIITAYHDTISSHFDLIKSLQRKNKELRQMRDLLLPKLICGEVDVSKLDIDEGNAVT